MIALIGLLLAPIAAAEPSSTKPFVICTNSSILTVPADMKVSESHAGVETAGYTLATPKGSVKVDENSLAPPWRNAKAMTLGNGQVVLRKRLATGVAYAFSRGGGEARPLLIVSGNGLSGASSDEAFLSRVRTMGLGQAEKSPTCSTVLHYGWDNVLGPNKP